MSLSPRVQRSLSALALIVTYMVFAMLLNSVAPVILQSMLTFHVDKVATSTLDACKDLPIAVTSLLLASYLPRLGYRRAMMIGLGIVALACMAMPTLPGFTVTRLMFVAVGVSFALVKVSVYSSIGLLTSNPKQHASLTALIEGLFMVGVLATSWVFSAFIDRETPGDPVWLHVYWLLGGLAAGAALLWAVVPLDESPAHRVTTQVVGGSVSSTSSGIASMFALLRFGLVATFIVSAFIYVLIEQAVQTWLPTFNNEVLKVPVAMSVQLASVYAGSLALGRLSASFILRFVRWPTLLITCLLMAAGLLFLTLHISVGAQATTGWSSLSAAALLLPTIGLFLSPVYPTICSTMLSALPLDKHASMTGLIVVFSALGGTSGSFITGRVFAATDGRTAFALALVPMALLLVALLLFDRQLRSPARQRNRVVVDS
jgi:fucose permease